MRSYLTIFACVVFLWSFSNFGFSQNINLDSIKQELNKISYPEKSISILKEINGGHLSFTEKISLLEEEIQTLEQSSEFPLQLATLYTTLANVYVASPKKQLAPPYLVKAKKLADEFGEDNKGWYSVRGDLHHFMAYTYFSQYQAEKAVEEANKSLKQLRLLNDTLRLGVILNSLGVFNSANENSEKAIQYYDEALPLLKKAAPESLWLRCQFCKAVDLIILEEYQKSKDVLLEIQPRIEATNHFNKKSVYNKLGLIELKLGNYKNAEPLLRKGFDQALEDNNWNSIGNASEQLYELMNKQGRYKEALYYFELKSAYSDSIQLQQNDQKTVEAQAEYEELGRKQKIQELELQQNIQQAKFRNWIFLLSSLFLLTIGGVGFYFYRQNTKKKQALTLAAKEQEVQKIRERLLASITHELRTPLTLILGKTAALKKHELDEEAGAFAESAHRNAEELLGQINQLLDWNQVEAKAMKLEPSVTNVTEFIHNVFEQIKESHLSKNMNWHINIPTKSLYAELDFNKLKTILSNLLSNAYKYTPENGNIELSLDLIDESQLRITVSDNGQGIDAEQSEKIFDWYYRAQQNTEEAAPGFGVGLALSKELTLLMGGKLELQSAKGKGSTFTLQIPFKKLEKELVQQKVITNTTEKTNGKVSPSYGNQSSNKPLVLVIEDHVELSNHIVQTLSDHFEVISTVSPFTGIEIALEKVPDIILTDIMLPGKSGLEICHDLKNNIISDHIPIVILTARTEASVKLQGLKKQADAFLTKPFKSEELILTLNNLIQNRRRLRLRYQMQVQDVEQREDPFIHLLMDTIKDSYTDNHFNVDAFAQKLKISRGQLFKKTKALLGISPSQLIKQYRLEKAKSKLELGLSVSETAYSSGFSTPEYFSTVYKEHFRMSPGEVAKGV